MKCPRCQNKNANKVTMNTHYCMECGIEFDTNTLKIFVIALDGSLKWIAKDEPIED